MNALPNDFRLPSSQQVQLKATRYDQVASLLISSLILIGVSVMLLFIVWVTQTLEFAGYKCKIRPLEPAGRKNDLVGFEQEMEAVEQVEIPELIEPQFAVELQTVTTAVSSVAALMRQRDSAATAIQTVASESILGGPSGRYRDDDVSDQIVPRGKRWQIRWTTSGIQAYARQLDYFKIELAAAGGKPTLDYASQLGKTRPDTREGTSASERRLYMSWKSGRLAEFDKAILARAGIPTDNRFVLQFYPELVEDHLAVIEMEHAIRQGHSSVKEFQRTYFGVRSKGAGYEFYVEDQQFRPLPRR